MSLFLFKHKLAFSHTDSSVICWQRAGKLCTCLCNMLSLASVVTERRSTFLTLTAWVENKHIPPVQCTLALPGLFLPNQMRKSSLHVIKKFLMYLFFCFIIILKKINKFTDLSRHIFSHVLHSRAFTIKVLKLKR